METPTELSPNESNVAAPTLQSRNEAGANTQEPTNNAPQPPPPSPPKNIANGPVGSVISKMTSLPAIASPQAPTSGATPSADASKEARTLRRHVVTLNKQLEEAETELQAQRVELERAAERMEKDRKRAKEEKEKASQQHTKELGALRVSNEEKLKEIQARFDERLAASEKKISDMENRRRQEGGDWSKEMENAIEREQEMHQKVIQME